MDNITLNNLKAQIGDNCIEWAEDYFSDDANFNTLLKKQDLYTSYVDYVGKKSALGVSKFKKAMQKYCELNSYVFNPKRLQDHSKRIMKNDVDMATQKRLKYECFYIENTKLNEEEKSLY